MATPHLVGRVGIKVMPDTSDFKERLKKDAKLAVEQVEKTLRAIHITVDVTATSMAAVKRKIEQVANSLDPAVLDVRVSDADLLRVESELEALQELVNEAVMGLSLDGADAAQVQAEISAIAEQAREILVTLNLPESEKAAVERALSDWENSNEPRNISIIPTLLNGSGAAVSARLSWLTREREAPIKPVINKPAYSAATAALTALAALSGGRAAWTWLDNLGNVLRNLDQALPAVAALALAIAGLTGWLASASANLASLAADLARIGALALTLPGILTGVAIGLGALVAVMADFNTVLPEVGDQLAALQDRMSQIFWERAAEPFRLFFTTLFPQFQAGLEATSAALGIFAASFATALTASLDGSLPAMFANLNAAIQIATGATGAWAESIRILGELGAAYLPRLALWVVDISDRFATFLAAAEADGRLTAWVDRGIASLFALGQVLTGLYGIFAGLATAAEQAGGASLASLAAQLQSISDTVNSAGFQEPLIGFLTAADRMMTNIATSSGEQVKSLFTALGETAQQSFPLIGQVIGTLIGGLAELLAHPAVQGGLQQFFQGLSLGVFWLMQAVEPLQPGLAALLGLLGTVATELGRLLGPVLGTVGQLLAVIAPVASELVSVLAEGLLAAFQLLAPLILAVAGYFAELVAALPLDLLVGLAVDILTPLVTLFMALVDAIMPLVIELLPPMYEAWLKIYEAILPLLEILTQILAAILVPLIEALLPGIIGYFAQWAEAMLPIIEQLLPGLVATLEFLMPLFVWLGEVIGAVVTAAFSILGAAVEMIWGVLSGLIDLIVGVFTGDWQMAWDGIVQIFTAVGDFLASIVEALWNLLVDIFGDGIAAIWDWITNMWDRIKEWWNQGVEDVVIASALLVLRAKAKFEEVKDKVLFAIRNLPDLLRAKMNEAKDKLLGVVTVLKSLLPDGIREMVDKAIDKVKGLPDKAKNVLSNIKNTLVNAGKNLIQGFIDGFESLFDDVESSLGGLTDSLTSWKGPPEKDRNLLTGAGRLVMGSFLTGLESQYDAIRASLRSFSNEIGAMEFAAPTGDISVTATSAIDTAARASDETGSAARVLNYYAAPSNSLSEEEALFTATNRALRLGW